jgi:hypothetical protein
MAQREVGGLRGNLLRATNASNFLGESVLLTPKGGFAKAGEALKSVGKGLDNFFSKKSGNVMSEGKFILEPSRKSHGEKGGECDE